MPIVNRFYSVGSTSLKIMAVLERIDDPSADDVLFVAKYNVKKVTKKVSTSTNDAYFIQLFKDNNPLVNMKQEVTLANKTYNLKGETTAASTVTVQNATINGSASLMAEEIVLNNNTTINPGMAMYGNISDLKGCRDVAPLCPNEIAAFCNSSKYKASAQ